LHLDSQLAIGIQLSQPRDNRFFLDSLSQRQISKKLQKEGGSKACENVHMWQLTTEDFYYPTSGKDNSPLYPKIILCTQKAHNDSDVLNEIYVDTLPYVFLGIFERLIVAEPKASRRYSSPHTLIEQIRGSEIYMLGGIFVVIGVASLSILLIKCSIKRCKQRQQKVKVIEMVEMPEGVADSYEYSSPSSSYGVNAYGKVVDTRSRFHLGKCFEKISRLVWCLKRNSSALPYRQAVSLADYSEIEKDNSSHHQHHYRVTTEQVPREIDDMYEVDLKNM
jgi:hypothetical protein